MPENGAKTAACAERRGFVRHYLAGAPPSGRHYTEIRLWPRNHIPNAITTAPARANQVMAYCR